MHAKVKRALGWAAVRALGAAGAMLALEASEVVRLRLEKFAQAEGDVEEEARLTVTEKLLAAIQVGAKLLAGASPAAIIGLYRERVAANAKRLSA